MRKKAERLRCAECAAECPPEREVYPYASHKRSCQMAKGFRDSIDGVAERIYSALFITTTVGQGLQVHHEKGYILAAIREELSR
jgi:hypothetical protein